MMIDKNLKFLFWVKSFIIKSVKVDKNKMKYFFIGKIKELKNT